MTTTTNITASNTTEQTRAKVLAVLTDLYAAWARGDAGAFADLYLADATVVMPGLLHEGRDAIRTYMAQAFDGPLNGSTAVDEPISVRFPNDDTAVVVSRSGVLMAGETEVSAAAERVATWVLVRRDDRWRIAAYANAAANVSAS